MPWNRALLGDIEMNMTFHCKLIIDNDENYYDDVQCLTTHVMTRIYHAHNGRAFEDQNRVRICILAEFIRNYVEEITDAEGEGRNNQMAQELILGAIQEIDFREIAKDLIGDYSPKSPAEVAEAEEYFMIMGFDNYDIDED